MLWGTINSVDGVVRVLSSTLQLENHFRKAMKNTCQLLLQFFIRRACKEDNGHYDLDVRGTGVWIDSGMRTCTTKESSSSVQCLIDLIYRSKYGCCI